MLIKGLWRTSSESAGSNGSRLEQPSLERGPSRGRARGLVSSSRSWAVFTKCGWSMWRGQRQSKVRRFGACCRPTT